jgi:hypothetical protein
VIRTQLSRASVIESSHNAKRWSLVEADDGMLVRGRHEPRECRIAGTESAISSRDDRGAARRRWVCVVSGPPRTSPSVAPANGRM